MMSRDVVQCFRDMNTSIEADAIVNYTRALKAKGTEAASRGVYRSGQHFVAIDEIAAETLRAAVPRIFAALIESNQTEPSADTRARADQLADLIGSAVDELHRRLAVERDAAARRLSAGAGLRDFALNELQRVAGTIRPSIVAKARLAALATERQTSGAATTTNNFTFQQAVGAVQTGAGASANVQQVISGPDMAHVLAALGVLRQAIASSDEPQRAETLEVIDQLEIEARKPKPNKLTVLSLVQGVSAVVRGIAAAPAAWDTITEWSNALVSAVS